MKDQIVYQIEAIEKLFDIKELFNIKKFKTADETELLKKYENNCNFAKYCKFAFKV